MKRVLLSLVCCLPLLFSPSISFSLEVAGENDGQTVSYERYGPISDVETLWSISTKLRPGSSVSIQQTLVAIYKLNPFAFYKGNINKIIPESIIKVPTLGFTQAQTAQEALALIGKYSTSTQQPLIARKQQTAIPEETPISAETKPVASEVPESISENPVDKKELVLLENELETLRKEYDIVNQQLSVTTENNESLQFKLLSINEQLIALSEQLESELLINEKLQNLVNEYSAQLDKVAERPFTGEGLVNEVLRFITSSLTTLLIAIISPALLLLVIFVSLTRFRSKRQVDEPESELSESNASVEEGNGPLASVLTENMAQAELANEAVHFNSAGNGVTKIVEPATEDELQKSNHGASDITQLAKQEITCSPASAVSNAESAVWESHSAAPAGDNEEMQNDSAGLPETILAADKTEPDEAALESEVQIPVLDFAEADIINLHDADFAVLPDADENLTSQLDDVALQTQAADGTAQVDDFIDIETLMGDADQDLKDEPYSELDLDLGLDEFPDVINLEDTIDIDEDENGIGAQLDLARAYLEIDDKAGAKKILLAVAEHSNGAQRVEIDSLLSRLA